MLTNWMEFLEQALDTFQEAVPDKVFAIVDGIIMPITLWEVES